MHLLILEDDLDLGAALQKALRGGGMSCEWFRRCADLPVAFLEQSYDCALLDLSLPDGSGLEVLRRWRHGGPRRSVRIGGAGDGRDRLDDAASRRAA